MNPEKLKKLQAQVRIGGKGTPRRKKKIVHSTPATDDKKLQSSLKKLSVNTIPGIEEVNIIKNDGTVINFNNPKAQASLPTNTFAITGHGENKSISEMLPGILAQLGPHDITQLKKFATEFAANKGAASSASISLNLNDDDVPDLVQNFEEVAIGGGAGTATPAPSTSAAPVSPPPTTTTAPVAAGGASSPSTESTESTATASPDSAAAKIEEIPVA